MTFDLKHLQHTGYAVIIFCTKFERSRAVHGGVIATAVFDLMTLNMGHVLRSVLG